MTGEEKGKQRDRRFWDRFDAMPKAKQRTWQNAQDDKERYPCDIFPKETPPEERWCFHTGCGVKAGELPRVVLFNNVFRSEAYRGWLRFLDVKDIARAYWALKKHWCETGEFSFTAAALLGVMPR